MSSIVQVGLLAGLAVVALAATPPFPDASPAQSHRLKLKPLVIPPSGQVGLFIMARVNGGPPLRLLLDSGAQLMVLDKKAAAKSRCCQGGSALDLIGAGATPKTAKAVTADTIEVGEIQLRHVDVVIVETRLLDGIDGVLPLALFADSVIRLDLRDKNLELKPYSNEPAVVSDSASRAVARNRLLFVKGILNDSYEGLFLLDTGATYNAISTSLARRMNSTAALTRLVSMQGGTAQLDAHFVSEILRLRVGSHDLHANPVVAVDLSLTSRYHHLEVSGLLGYPALRDCIVTVNYRDGLVEIDPR